MTVLNQLTKDLANSILFRIANLTNVSRPGAKLRVQDQITFDVFVDSTSPVPIKNLEVSVSPSSATANGGFIGQNVTIDLIPAFRSIKVVTIEAKITSDPNNFRHFGIWNLDILAIVRANGVACLSEVAFSDGGILVGEVWPE